VFKDFKLLRKYYSELIRACFEERSLQPIPDGISEEDIIKYAIKGQIQYPILSSLLKTNISDCNIDRVRNIIKYSTITTFLQVATAKSVSAKLEEAGVKHQLLKGAVIKDIYPSYEMRQMSDIDIIIYDESMDNATKIIENMGFHNHGLVKHHIIFRNDNNICIEAHWCLIDKNVDKKQHLYFKDNFKARLKEDTDYTYEFSVEDFYIYMIAHMAKHFYETGCGVRNLIDIYVYINRYKDEMDNSYLSKELEGCGLKDFEYHARKLAYIWLDDEECSNFYENLFAYMLDGGIYGKGENGIWSQLAKETDDGNNVKLHYYFPSYTYMKEKYKWLEHKKFLLPVAWGIRAAEAFCSRDSFKHMENLESSSLDDVNTMLDIYHKLNLNYKR